MTDLPALLARVEAATGPDRELDAAILEATSPYRNHAAYNSWRAAASAFGWDMRVTASLDAALALVERLLPERDDAYQTMRAALLDKRLFGNRMSEALPLALLAALLRSLIEAR